MIFALVALSLGVYMLFSFWDRRLLKDEREQLIELKASDLQGRATLLALVVLTVVYWMNPELPVWICLITINVANLYTEMFGKLYWRWKM